jgi:hypothetical protein
MTKSFLRTLLGLDDPVWVIYLAGIVALMVALLTKAISPDRAVLAFTGWMLILILVLTVRFGIAILRIRSKSK